MHATLDLSQFQVPPSKGLSLARFSRAVEPCPHFRWRFLRNEQGEVREAFSDSGDGWWWSFILRKWMPL